MEKITVLAEKPSVARDIAKVLGATDAKDGYLEGNGYYVTYAFGHLVGLAEPQAYGFSESWIKEDLPMLPDSFKLVPKKDAKKQLSTISKLFKDSKSIVVATDAGREGELIFRLIYEYLSVNRPFKRLWISDMTEKSISQGFNNLLEGKAKDSLYYSAKARAESDWLIGLNATRLLSINNKNMISIGRVQTPTLRLIVDRYLDNKNFVVTDYWKAFIEIDNNNPSELIKLVCDKEFSDENSIKNYIRNIENIKNCIISREDKKEKEKAPKLYSLTSLQKDANTKLNFTADQTLNVLQSLYEVHKLVTYPRTDSEFLTDNQIEEVAETLKSHSQYFPQSNVVYENISKNTAFNNSKVTDHHAVIPTHIIPSNSVISKLNADEKDLYNLVIIRFFQRFSPDCEKDKVFLTTQINSEVFSSSQTTETFKGWKIYVPEPKTNEEPKIMVKNGEDKKVINHSYSKHQTSPKPIHNESSLLSAMETAGKEIENEDLKEQMKGKGLGTPATRSSIIELLIKRKFVDRKGKQLIPTPTGIDLIDKIRDHKISIPEWTAEQEYELFKVETGENDYISYMKRIKEITKGIVLDLDSVKINIQASEKIQLGVCPKCKKGQIREGKKGYGCSEYTSGCDFVIWKNTGNKVLPITAVQSLLSTGWSKKIKGFKKRTGESFDAYLFLNEEYKVTYSYETKSEREWRLEQLKKIRKGKEDLDALGKVISGIESGEILPITSMEKMPGRVTTIELNNGNNTLGGICGCPKCKKGRIIESSNVYKCTESKDECGFVIWKEKSKKTLSISMIQALITKGVTGEIKGFVSEKGKKFDSKLVLTKDFKVLFEFQAKN